MSKKQGELAELRFKLKALEKGFSVSSPHGDSDKYDFIVDSAGVLNRVQVKSTAFYNSAKSCYGLNIGSGASKKIAYSENDIDILACYIIPNDEFYIIPISEMSGQVKVSIYNSEDSKYHKYKEAWELLKLPDTTKGKNKTT